MPHGITRQCSPVQCSIFNHFKWLNKMSQCNTCIFYKHHHCTQNAPARYHFRVSRKLIFWGCFLHFSRTISATSLYCYRALGLSVSSMEDHRRFAIIKWGLRLVAWNHLDGTYTYKNQPYRCMANFRFCVSRRILFVKFRWFMAYHRHPRIFLKYL